MTDTTVWTENWSSEGKENFEQMEEEADWYHDSRARFGDISF